MQAILKKQIKDLTNEVTLALSIVQKTIPSRELNPFRDWLVGFYEHILPQLTRLNIQLDLDEESIYADVYSSTARLQRDFRLINTRFLPALYRHQQQDKMALTMLEWLHSEHYQAEDKPFAVQDADFAILPTVELPLIYFLPITSQHTLLHLPLFFHEFGHFLFVYHQQKMVDITSDLQRRLEEYLIIPFSQNDEKYKSAKKRNDLIVETWFDWLNELFCDAVGLYIGGPAYLHSFSSYLLTTGTSAFTTPEKYLPKSKHPITWLRIKVMCHLAKQWGLNGEADTILDEWSQVAQNVCSSENYYGYYHDMYLGDILQALEAMLYEASPISFNNYDYNTGETDLSNYVQLMNTAWKKYLEDPDTYFSWEASVFNQASADLSDDSDSLVKLVA